MRRLYVLIYVTFVAIGLGTLISTGLVAAFLWEGPDMPSVDAAAVIAAESHVAPDELERRLQALSDETGASFTVWQRHGGIVAQVGEPLAEGRGAWVRHRSVRVRLGGGRVLVAGFPRSPWMRFRPLLMLAVMAGAVAIGSYPLARRITRRLELVEEGVEQWGAGDLSTRVPVLGQDEIAEVARTFNRAAEQVERLFEAQRRVLASTSHEIRSPLARLRMAIELADEGLAQPGWVEQAIRDVEELDATVEDLLTVGRMQAVAGPANPETVDLRALLEEEAAHVGAEVQGPPLEVQGDARLLRRLARNLLENARKHGAPPIEVEIRADGFAVHDRGAGVPEDLREQIFEPFYRPAGHAEGRDGGVGLGLHLVREIARHHGGRVEVEPREGGGATFRVTLSTR